MTAYPSVLPAAYAGRCRRRGADPDSPRMVLLHGLGGSAGSWDRFVARDLTGALANARCTEIDGCGHFPIIERPEQFSLAIARFLESIGPATKPELL